jgi:hypothetical protein
MFTHAAGRGVSALGSEKRHGAVAPVVLEFFAGHGIDVEILVFVEFLIGRSSTAVNRVL